MGFGKHSEDADDEAAPTKKRKSKGGDDNLTKKDKFEPTSNQELKALAKRVRKKERAKSKEKTDRKENLEKLPRLKGDALRTALEKRRPFKVYASNLFNKFIDICKENDTPKPRYRSYLEVKEAEGQFMFDIASALSRMSWPQLTDLLRAAVTTEDKPLAIATRSWSEVSNFVEHCMYVALGVVEKKGMLRLTDPSVLEDWPVEERKRKSKEDRAMDEQQEELEKRKLLAAAKDDDDEDDEDEDEDEDDSDDEDDDEDNDDDDEDEDEKPKKKVKGESKKASKDDDEDEDDEGTDDDDDEDSKSSKRSSKKSKSNGKKGGKFGKRTSKSDDDDEDEAEDADDEDDEKSSKRKRKEKSVSSKKKGKADKSDKKTSKKSAAPKERAEKVEFSDKTTIAKVKDRDKGGPKSALLALIPKKGITIKALNAAAKEEGISASKVKGFVKFLHSYGYIKAK